MTKQGFADLDWKEVEKKVKEVLHDNRPLIYEMPLGPERRDPRGLNNDLLGMLGTIQGFEHPGANPAQFKALL